MRKDEFSQTLRDQMRGARVSPQLRRQALYAARGKEEKTVKKKISMALVFALVSVLAASVALAAAMNRAGVLDFVSRYSDIYIPQDASDYVQTDVIAFETDEATVTLRELYYDGYSVRMTADVTPKDDKTLLMGVDSWVEDSWQDLITLTWDEADERDTRSIADVFAENGFERAYNVNIASQQEEDDMPVIATEDFVLGEDGVLTVFGEWKYMDDRPEREVVMLALFSPYVADADGRPVGTRENRRYAFPLTLTATSRGEESAAQAYVSTEPVLYERIGVRVDRVMIEVKPLELYATIDYTVVDEALYAATDDGLWFEFVDETIVTDQPYDQRLAGGLSGSSGIDALGRDRFRQNETLGLNELQDVYTLRAYSAWEKVRYEAHDIAMRPATAEDIAAAHAEKAVFDLPEADVSAEAGEENG